MYIGVALELWCGRYGLTMAQLPYRYSIGALSPPYRYPIAPALSGIIILEPHGEAQLQNT